jgi:hypothetical protein
VRLLLDRGEKGVHVEVHDDPRPPVHDVACRAARVQLPTSGL